MPKKVREFRSEYKGQDTSLISGRTFDATKLNNIFGTPGSFHIINYHLASDGVWKKFIKTEFTTKQTAHFWEVGDLERTLSIQTLYLLLQFLWKVYLHEIRKKNNLSLQCLHNLEV